jgi:hypothetical protein
MLDSTGGTTYNKFVADFFGDFKSAIGAQICRLISETKKMRPSNAPIPRHSRLLS